jgi:hypothetical protein
VTNKWWSSWSLHGVSRLATEMVKFPSRMKWCNWPSQETAGDASLSSSLARKCLQEVWVERAKWFEGRATELEDTQVGGV